MSVLQSIYVDAEGNISCRKGDSGSVFLTGIPTDDNYKISLGVVNPPDRVILNEVSVDSNNSSEAEIPLSVDFTESLGVGRFFYGIKLTDSYGQEHTVIPNSYMDADGQIEIASPNTFIVKPKLAEGL